MIFSKIRIKISVDCGTIGASPETADFRVIPAHSGINARQRTRIVAGIAAETRQGHAAIRPGLQGDGCDQPPVVGILGMHRPTIGKESHRVAVGAVTRPVRLPHARTAQAVQPIGRQVELQPVALALHEKSRRGVVHAQEPVAKLRPDLVGALADARPDHRADALAHGAKPDHGCHGFVEDAVDGPAAGPAESVALVAWFAAQMEAAELLVIGAAAPDTQVPTRALPVSAVDLA